MNATKTEKNDRIYKVLTEMKTGHCGVKFDCLVWRISEHRWHVGMNGIDHRKESFNIDEAISYIGYH